MLRTPPGVFVPLGLGLFALAHAIGLFIAPPEAFMGETGRLLHLHLPTAWGALGCYTVAFGAAVASLWTGGARWQALLRAAVGPGLVLNALVLFQGAMWARPTWGVWWVTDLRTSSAIAMLVGFGIVHLLGILLRGERALVWTGVAAVIAFIDVPVVYFSVKFTRTIHQEWSSPATISPELHLPLGTALLGMVVFLVGLIGLRWRQLRP